MCATCKIRVVFFFSSKLISFFFIEIRSAIIKKINSSENNTITYSSLQKANFFYFIHTWTNCKLKKYPYNKIFLACTNHIALLHPEGYMWSYT